MSARNTFLQKILIVDDDLQITKVLRTALSSQGYSLHVASDGVEGMVVARGWQPDLVIADISMPKMNGIEFCQQFREISSAPIIVLSVMEDELTRIEALEAGADDYIIKPFGIQELFARVRAKFRRRPGNASESNTFAVGDFYFNMVQHRVTVRDQSVRLTPLQFDLLLFFAEHADQVLAHRVILQNVWGVDEDRPEYIRVHVGQLRKIIEISEKPQYIVTEPWIGYRFHALGGAVDMPADVL
jgi:two-component system, OmpR family, KDP operon response regulator KdpE